ncbi:unnamed protein product [Arabidopsis halleri]
MSLYFVFSGTFLSPLLRFLLFFLVTKNTKIPLSLFFLFIFSIVTPKFTRRHQPKIPLFFFFVFYDHLNTIAILLLVFPFFFPTISHKN